MLLALDIGNTNVVGGLYDGARLVTKWRVSTERQRTADEIQVLWGGLFSARQVTPSALTGACIASVVPSLTPSYTAFTSELLGLRTLRVGIDIDLGLIVDTDNPPEVGADRIANALAARERYGAPAIVVDFGTSTNFDVVSRDGNFAGGAIAPGMGGSMEALVSRAAQLFRVSLAPPGQAIGRNTIAAMQAGLFYGYVGLVEGLIDRIRAELPAPAVVVATGGLAGTIAAHTAHIQHVDPDLTLEGIRLIWERNPGVSNV